MLKRFLLIGGVLCFLLSMVQAQSTTIVILPFTAEAEAGPYPTALPLALQRSLNLIDQVFVPPVGDALLVSRQLQQKDSFTPQAIAAAFAADYVISGRLSLSGTELRTVLGISHVASGTVQNVTVLAPFENSSEVLQRTLNVLLEPLSLSRSAADAEELALMLAQLPPLTTLPAVAEAAMRLAAPETDSLAGVTGSWGLAELARLQALSGNLGEAERVSLESYRSNQKDIEALIVRADILRLQGDTVNAEQIYKQALAVNPGHPFALEGMALLSEAATAKNYLEQAVATYPRLVTAYLNLAELEMPGQPARALQILRQGAGRVPESLTLHRAIMRQASAIEGPRAALTYLQQALADERLVSAGLYSLVSILDKSLLSESLALIQQGRQRYPESTPLALIEAQLWVDSANPAQAEVVLQQARVISPDDLTLVNELARIQAEQGKLAEAKATLESAPSNDTLLINLAQVYLEVGEAQAAVDVLAPLLSRRPDDAQLFSLYGVALGYTGNVSQALNALDQALALDGQLEQALVAKAVFEQQLALTEGERFSFLPEAEQAFQLGLEALSRQDYSAAALYFSSAFGQQDAGLIAFYEGYARLLGQQPREAIIRFERALEDFPESDIVQNNLGYAYLQVGRYDRAMALIDDALAANPDNPEANLNKGLTLIALKRYADAVPFFEQAVVLKPALSAQVSPLLEEVRRLGAP